MANQLLIKNFKNSLQALLLGSVCFFAACETAPPVQEMSDARQAIAVAKKAGAADLASFHLDAAEKYLASAEQSLGRQAYHQARRDANHAKMKALDALKAAEREASKKQDSRDN